MAGEEEVTAPDQHKPGHRKSGTVGAIITIALLLAMAFLGNRNGGSIVWWLVGIAILIAVLLVGDWALRRGGLRS